MKNMPNDNAPICGCMALETPKTRNNLSSSSTALSTRNLTILIPKTSSKGSRVDGRGSKRQQHQEDHVRHQGPKTRAPDSGSTSSVAHQMNGASHHTSNNGNKQEKRLNASRRTRSAERSDSHYTYIDSGSSILGGGIRENTIPEALYSTVQETSPNSITLNGESVTISNQANTLNRGSQVVYAVPSMTSPPPTYDVAIAKTCQSGLPPSYDEYLCHKYAMLSRSHTPPPPWSDSSHPRIQQARLEHLASQPELREYLAQVALEQTSHHSQQQQQQQQQGVSRDSASLSNHQQQQQQQQQQQALRLQAAAVRQQRARAMPPRSQSESRAHQQRIATMYDDAAFCMETTAITSAFEHGVAFCSLM